MFDLIANFFGIKNSSNDLEKYIKNELNFRESDFVKYVVFQARFDVNPAEKDWFLHQTQSKQQAYLLLLFECENQSGKETHDQLGHLHFMSPEFKAARDISMKRYGLHLWGDEFIRFHEPQLH
jgi:hypothetical protein